MARPPLVRAEITQPLDKAYRIIPLTKDQVTLVSLRVYRNLAPFNWSALWNRKYKRFYAVRYKRSKKGNSVFVYMHREIKGAKKSQHVDHKNGNSLDNRDDNLRTCTRSQNLCNRGKTKRNSTGYKGVSRDKRRNRFVANIRCQNESYYLGSFLDRQSAANAYDAAAIRLHGEFARLNHLPTFN